MYSLFIFASKYIFLQTIVRCITFRVIMVVSQLGVIHWQAVFRLHNKLPVYTNVLQTHNTEKGVH